MGTEATSRAPKTALVRTTALCKRYEQGSISGKRFTIDALSDVELDLAPGCLTALVGGSGSGKSTLAKCLAMLEKPDSGEIWFEGKTVWPGTERESARLRPMIQLVFQDSAAALNPASPRRNYCGASGNPEPGTRPKVACAGLRIDG